MEILSLLRRCLAYVQNFTQQFDQFDAGATERTFVFVCAATILVDHLQWKNGMLDDYKYCSIDTKKHTTYLRVVLRVVACKIHHTVEGEHARRCFHEILCRINVALET